MQLPVGKKLDRLPGDLSNMILFLGFGLAQSQYVLRQECRWVFGTDLKRQHSSGEHALSVSVGETILGSGQSPRTVLQIFDLHLFQACWCMGKMRYSAGDAKAASCRWHLAKKDFFRA